MPTWSNCRTGCQPSRDTCANKARPLKQQLNYWQRNQKNRKEKHQYAHCNNCDVMWIASTHFCHVHAFSRRIAHYSVGDRQAANFLMSDMHAVQNMEKPNVGPLKGPVMIQHKMKLRFQGRAFLQFVIMTSFQSLQDSKTVSSEVCVGVCVCGIKNNYWSMWNITGPLGNRSQSLPSGHLEASRLKQFNNLLTCQLLWHFKLFCAHWQLNFRGSHSVFAECLRFYLTIKEKG